MDSGILGPNTEICPDFSEIWHLQQIENANYEYNTCQCLELFVIIDTNDYRLRMIIGCKIQPTERP